MKGAGDKEEWREEKHHRGKSDEGMIEKRRRH